jgi:hypothetical protein
MKWLPEPWRDQLEYWGASRIIPQVHKLKVRKRLANTVAHAAETFDHSSWDAVLKTHVTTGGTLIDGKQIIEDVSLVDYGGIANDSRFQRYLEQLSVAEIDGLPPAEQLALLLNAYNALCICLIVQNYKAGALRSIMDLSTPQSKVWDLPAGRLGGKSVSLNHIEHQLLRAGWAEPDMHACIVCASASCPNLATAAFTGERLAEQMHERMRQFCRNPTKGVHWTAEGRVLRLSRICLWFANDFGGFRGAAEHAVAAVRDDADPRYLPAQPDMQRASLRYFRYSWLLNAKKQPECREADMTPER